MPINPKDKLVLVVEDDDDYRNLLVQMLSREGFRVETAIDGMQALEKMRALKPDLALMDLMLPKYGGVEMIRELYRGTTGTIPVIVVTGRYTSREDCLSVLNNSNVATIIEKPVKIKTLLETVHQILATAPTTPAPVVPDLILDKCLR